jgi:hypothetical protein
MGFYRKVVVLYTIRQHTKMHILHRITHHTKQNSTQNYLLTYSVALVELYRTSARRFSAKLVPTSADRGCHVVSVTDPYGRILGCLDRTCCVNPIDNTHYAPITSLEHFTKYITRTLEQSTNNKGQITHNGYNTKRMQKIDSFSIHSDIPTCRLHIYTQYWLRQYHLIFRLFSIGMSARGDQSWLISPAQPQQILFPLKYYLDRLCGLEVRVPGYRSRGPGSIPQMFWASMGLERGPLSLVSTIEELLERKSCGSFLEIREYGRGDPSRWTRGTLYSQKLALTLPTWDCLSVGIVRSRTQATE